VICYNCGGPGYYARDCMNPTQSSCLYCTLFDHEMEDCPTLINVPGQHVILQSANQRCLLYIVIRDTPVLSI